MPLNELHTEHEHASLSIKVLLLIFAVLLVGVLGYLVWNENRATTDDSTSVHPKATTSTTTTTTTTDPTADWKTYANTRVSYSFEYPSSGLTLDLDETIKYSSSSGSDSKTEDLVQYASKTVTYGVRTNIGVSATSIESWIQDTNTSHLDGDLSKYTKTTVNGKTAYTFAGELATYVMNGVNVYKITGHKGVAPSTDTSDKTYLHLVSSFKFTE